MKKKKKLARLDGTTPGYTTLKDSAIEVHRKSFEKRSFDTIVLSLIHYYLLTICWKLLVYCNFSQLVGKK